MSINNGLLTQLAAVVAIHVHIIVTHHGQSFKAPPAYQTCTREASAAPALRSDAYPEIIRVKSKRLIYGIS